MKQLPPAGRWIAFVAVLSACSTEEKTPSQNLAAAPNVVSLTATEYAFEAPDTIPAGWTTFRLANRGQEVHYGHMVRLEPGRTVRELVDAYAEAIRTSGPRPKWVTRFGGPGGAAPGDSSSVTQYLEPGSYVWICPVEDNAGTPHFSKGEFKPFVVRAADGVVADRAAGPEADAGGPSHGLFVRTRFACPGRAAHDPCRECGCGAARPGHDETRAGNDGCGHCDRVESGARATSRPGGAAATSAGEPWDGSRGHRGNRAGDGVVLRGKLEPR